MLQKLVIKTKSVEYMPLSLSVASFANGVAWTIYALLPFDPYILVISSHIFLLKLNIVLIQVGLN